VSLRTDHHELPVHEVVLLLETDAERGLTNEEAAHRLRRFGPNVLPHFERRGALARFLLQFHNPLVYVLIASGAVTVALGEVVDGSVIAGVVVVNAVVGFVQESRAERALSALARMVEAEATVVRDGERHRLAASELVPGDLVLLEAGDKVPADLRLLWVRGLEVDESALTGESAPVAKSPLEVAPGTPLADRQNMAYAGTLVTSGSGAGLAVATGEETEIGRLHRLLGEAEGVDTPLTRKIARFSRLLTGVILGLAAATFVLGIARGEKAAEMVTAAVALAVAAIPEGLPAVITITLAVGVARMARRHAIIRRLPAVEALGSATVICADKTGTLTENQMTVVAIVAARDTFAVTGTGYAPDGVVLADGEPADVCGHAPLRECLLAGLLCNDARVVQHDGRWEAVGDPTEAALLVAAGKAGFVREEVAARLPRRERLPFDPSRRYMATRHSQGPEQPDVVYVKGALEAVLELCDSELEAAGVTRPIERDRWVAVADELASAGLRVLAFGRGEALGDCSVEEAVVGGRFTFLGIQAMHDPPRPEAIAAVAKCRGAGIAVKMITGDHARTAEAVARRIGLVVGDGETAVVTGPDLHGLPVGTLTDVAEHAAVFARVSPEQKLDLVRALQRRGHVVAMTGDGVNDAPALRQADIGVAMGRSGTEVARESADMVLTDDNFASIEAAVEEGRTVFDNLTKFIVWALPTSLGEGLVILVAIVAGTPLPILPVQVLWVNMTTAVVLGLPLAFEPAEVDVMRRPPRDPRRPLLTGDLVLRILLVAGLMLGGAFGLFHWERERGAEVAEARTAAVNVFVAIEAAYLFNCRSLTRSAWRRDAPVNPLAWAGVAVMTGLQGAFTYAGAMNGLFHSAPLGAAAWARIVAMGLAVHALVGLEKWARRRLGSRRG
jgi:magnesium-transporting ATPase (P-type)